MIKINGFQLHKVKFRKDLGISAEYSTITAMGDNDAIRKSITVNCAAAAHPDLLRITARLRQHFAAIFGILPVSLVMKDLDDMDESEQKKLQDVVERVTMTGVTFIGNDDSDSKYTMSATLELLPNGFVGCATPMIAQDDSRYEPSGELTELLENLNDEVYEYAINSKYAQLSLPMTFGKPDSDSNSDSNSDSDSEKKPKGLPF